MSFLSCGNLIIFTWPWSDIWGWSSLPQFQAYPSGLVAAHSSHSHSWLKNCFYICCPLTSYRCISPHPWWWYCHVCRVGLFIKFMRVFNYTLSPTVHLAGIAPELELFNSANFYVSVCVMIVHVCEIFSFYLWSNLSTLAHTWSLACHLQALMRVWGTQTIAPPLTMSGINSSKRHLVYRLETSFIHNHAWETSKGWRDTELNVNHRR